MWPMRSCGCLNCSSSFPWLASPLGDRRLWPSSWVSSRPHEVCTLSLECTQALYSAILLLFLPLQWYSLIKDRWLLLQTLKTITPLQSFTAPLSHHILPHPIYFLPHSHHRISYFLLILGHWQVNSVDLASPNGGPRSGSRGSDGSVRTHGQSDKSTPIDFHGTFSQWSWL